jgi:glycosyltransferase involved in cell wall biosynthesis/SAM-dependent methyltransferase
MPLRSNLKLFDSQIEKASALIEEHVPLAIRRGAFLDIGCGIGNGVIAALRHGASLAIGVDIDLSLFAHEFVPAEFRAICRHFGVDADRALLIEADLLAMKLLPGTIDLCIMLDAAEHVPSPWRFIQIAHDCLAEGGYFVLDASPLYYSPVGHHFFHLFSRETDAWIHLRPDFESCLPMANDSEWHEQNFRRLNRVTHQELRDAFIGAGFNLLREDRGKENADLAALFEKFGPLIDPALGVKRQWLFEERIVLVGRKGAERSANFDVTLPTHEVLSFSVIINTDSRAAALGNTLRSLCHLDYPRFEVCVVHGPTADGTRELLEAWRGRIKIAACPVRNLTISRNIGIALAAGDVLAFLDDDAIPEPEWLRDLAAAYDAPDVGGAGGFVYDHTGASFQCRYMTLDRLGVARERDRATPELNFPLSNDIPHLLGTNCSFRRNALIGMGGFDEEIGRYLDESDVCCRMVDHGFLLKQVAGAYVHHGLLPDDLRTERRITRAWYPLVKNKLYFPLANGRKHHTIDAILADARTFTKNYADHTAYVIERGFLPKDDRRRFRQEADRGWRDGLRAGLAGERRFISGDTLRRYAQDFLPFAATIPAGGRMTFCLLSQDYPPGHLGGIGRYMHQLARSMAARGHHVHVLTRGHERDRIAFVDSVWVHRMVPREHAPPAFADGVRVPPHIWNYAATMAQEIARIAEHRQVDAVYAPLWDCEGLALLTDGRFPLVTALQTPLRSYLDHNPQLAADPRFMADFGTPMLAVEKRLLQGSAAIHAISAAIATDIERAYAVSLRPPRLTVVPLGLEDWSRLPAVQPAASPDGTVRILFVGRLEPRKGIDVLLAAAKALLPGRQHVHLDVVGSDPFAADERRSYRAAFERDPAAAAIRDRVRFHGEASDEVLRGFYRACDVFVAPSRYESFGLVLIEAMMFAKPVIACRAGGMPDVVADGATGLLAEPADAASLLACLERLVDDGVLRRRMGATGRSRYEERFTPERMTDALIDFLSAVGSAPRPSQHALQPSEPSVGARTPEPARAEPFGDDRAGARPARVAVVCSVLARHDGVAAVVRHAIATLRRHGQYEVSVFTARNDFAEVPAHVVEGVGQLLLHPAFLAADLVIYQFAIYHPLFDALIAGGPRAKQIVVFHNVTPAELVSPEQRPVIELSFRQLFNLQYADRIWADSEVNAAELVARGFDPDQIEVIPLAVDRPPPAALADKPRGTVELVFVGRIVASKGVLDLVEAVDRVRRACDVPFRLSIAGNLEYSHPAYVDAVRHAIAERGLACVRFLGTVEDDVLASLYRAAHILAIPSYHEGFCAPVIEALRSGCIPVGYAAYNVPNVANRLGRMVALGDRVALAAALTETIAAVAQSAGQPDAPLLPLDCGIVSRRAFDQAARAHVAQFTPERVGDAMLRSITAVLAAPARASGAAGARFVGDDGRMTITARR